MKQNLNTKFKFVIIKKKKDIFVIILGWEIEISLHYYIISIQIEKTHISFQKEKIHTNSGGAKQNDFVIMNC